MNFIDVIIETIDKNRHDIVDISPYRLNEFSIDEEILEEVLRDAIDNYEPYHLIQFFPDETFTIIHPVAERIRGILFDCDVYHEAQEAFYYPRHDEQNWPYDFIYEHGNGPHKIELIENGVVISEL